MTQTIELAAGWNWISTNVETTLDGLKAALVAASPETSSIIKSKTNGQTTYNGVIWTGALNTMDLSQMHEVQVNNACTITLEGPQINPENFPATIIKGSNWIAFPLLENMMVGNAFEGFAHVQDNIKSKAKGQSTWNGTIWTGALKVLTPGQGYIYKSTATGDQTFTFPKSK